jgi:DNA (cytosine-5)-methyltransferase 1
MDLGFRRKGFLPLLALDRNHAAVETYNFNDPRNVARQCDLSKLSGAELIAMIREASPKHMPCGVIGGPPCQSFSNGNRSKSQRDPRARLGLAFASQLQKVNKEFNIDFVVFENVMGLRGEQHAHRFESILRELKRAGFNLFICDLQAADFGIPQKRRRLLIVGVNRDKFPWVQFEFPQGDKKPGTVGQAIRNLPRPVFYRRGLKPENIPVHPNHWTMVPRSAKFRNGIHGNGRSFKKLSWGKPSFTVAYGNREIHVHPNGKRRLSVLEAMLLQAFPRRYELRGTLSDQVNQISDAVPPPLAAAVAGAIRKSIYAPIGKLQKSLLRWFDKNQRTFPWRQTRDPYRVLIAEKLLQQTAARDSVVTAYEKIITKYPNWNALARASRRVLKDIVTPLGFTYRADELMKLARAVVRRHKGDVPSRIETLLTLPGIGHYSARAVLSFVFDQPIAIVDTNVARFLVRYFGLKQRLSKNPARDRRLHKVADALIPLDRSRDFNLAMLDLCGAYCKARRPQCGSCPVRTGCALWQGQNHSGVRSLNLVRN